MVNSRLHYEKPYCEIAHFNQLIACCNAILYVNIDTKDRVMAIL